MDDSGEAKSFSKPALSVKKPAGALGCGGCLMIPFFGIFAASGGLILWISALGPAVKVIQARSWESVPCTVVTSEVEGDDTYKVAITFSYEVNGQSRTGDDYSFADLSSSGKAGKQKIVDQYPPGLKTTCFVNPSNIDEAVLYRGLRSSMWWGLFSVPFLAVGLGGMIGMLWFRNKVTDLKSGTRALEGVDSYTEDNEKESAPRRSATIVTVSDSDYDDDDLQEEPGPVTLKPEMSPLGTFIGLLIVTLIVNGVVLVFTFDTLKDWLQLDFELVELFAVPFLLAALALVLFTVRAGLTLSNPVPLITLSRRLLPLGSDATISWEFQGSTRALKTLKFLLKGIEEAKYRRGTDTHTDTHTFLEQALFETSEPSEIANGRVNVRIPTDTMHSFSGGNNKVRWQLLLRCEIALWPDVNADFPLRVVPHE